MAKNIILCSDGTGNRGGQGVTTNVWRLYSALDLGVLQGDVKDPSSDVCKQIAIHDDGVGTEDLRYLRWITGAFGLGLKRNIRQLYQFLASNFTPGDNIYIFGFSRGAYTARMLAELISICGVVEPAKARQHSVEMGAVAREAVEVLREQFFLSAARRVRGEAYENEIKKRADQKALAFRSKYAFDETADCEKPIIKFVGIWDTVPAYGFPLHGLGRFWNYFVYPYMLEDSHLNPRIEYAAHALAIDEQRKTFSPTLWNQESQDDKKRIKQVWFPGMHAGVGGGYAKNGLAMLTLDWMIDQATSIENGASKLRFSESARNAIASQANPFDRMYDSRAGIKVFYRYEPRDIKSLSREYGIEKPSIHVSTLERAATQTHGYVPGNVPSEVVVEGYGGEAWDTPSETRTATGTGIGFASDSKSHWVGQLLSRLSLVKREDARRQIALRKTLHWISMAGGAALLAIGSETLRKFILNDSICAPKYSLISYLETGAYVEKILSLIPLGSWFAKDIFQPLANCHNMLIGFIVLFVGVFWVGKLAKENINRKYDKFWSTVVEKKDQ